MSAKTISICKIINCRKIDEMYPLTDVTLILKTIPWFLDLKPKVIQRLAVITSIRQLDTGESLYEEGGKEDFLYIILEGEFSFEIFVPSFGPVRAYNAEPLDILGFSALTPVIRQRTGTAIAMKPSRVIQIDADSLKQLCDDDSDLGYIIYRRVANIAAARLLTTRIQLLQLIAEGVKVPTME